MQLPNGIEKTKNKLNHKQLLSRLQLPRSGNVTSSCCCDSCISWDLQSNTTSMASFTAGWCAIPGHAFRSLGSALHCSTIQKSMYSRPNLTLLQLKLLAYEANLTLLLQGQSKCPSQFRPAPVKLARCRSSSGRLRTLSTITRFGFRPPAARPTTDSISRRCTSESLQPHAVFPQFRPSHHKQRHGRELTRAPTASGLTPPVLSQTSTCRSPAALRGRAASAPASGGSDASSQQRLPPFWPCRSTGLLPLLFPPVLAYLARKHLARKHGDHSPGPALRSQSPATQSPCHRTQPVREGLQITSPTTDCFCTDSGSASPQSFALFRG